MLMGKKDDSKFVRVQRKFSHYITMPRGVKSISLYIFAILILYVVIDISGIFRHPLERDYHTEFSYPLDIENFNTVVDGFRQGEPVAYSPINYNYSTLKFLNKPAQGCSGPIRLLILVKSALPHFRKREVIRSTWGYTRRFSDVSIKTVFLFGEAADPLQKVTIKDRTVLLEPSLQDEIQTYKDVVRANFTDSYYNNTMKTMMGMRWAAENCPNFRFIFFVDDDMYVSIKNLLKFVRHPTQYPEYWEEQKKNEPYHSSTKIRHVADHTNGLASNAVPNPGRLTAFSDVKTDVNKGKANVNKNAPSDFDIDLAPDAKLYTGYVFFVPPHRHKVGTKWFLPLSEYPFNYFPPYVPAGAIVLSNAAFLDIYYASFFTRHFRFDDIYVALCAKKMGIEPYHTNYFRFWPAPVKDPYEKDYEYVVTSHGFDDPEELFSFWSIQKTLGHA